MKALTSTDTRGSRRGFMVGSVRRCRRAGPIGVGSRVLFGRFTRRQPAGFFDLVVDRDGDAADDAGELRLVEPSFLDVDPFLRAFSHPACHEEPDLRVEPSRLHASLRRWPRGRERCEPRNGVSLGYRFWMHLVSPGHVGFAGWVTLRIPTPDAAGRRMSRFLGDVGYVVLPPARGRRLAERATRLLFPLARQHGMGAITLTCNPENAPSRRTIERLGGRLVEAVDIPRDHPLYTAGERRKVRFQIDLGDVAAPPGR